jgi:hypothetical protein
MGMGVDAPWHYVLAISVYNFTPGRNIDALANGLNLSIMTQYV